MAVVNRSLDGSQQKEVMKLVFGALATGVTAQIGIVPNPCTVTAAQIAAFGVSTTPSYELGVQRFIVGAGLTYIILGKGSSNALAYDFGVSGVVSTGMKLEAAGSTLLNLLANDVLCLTTGGSNAAAKSLALGVVLQPVQDIKQWFGGIG